MASFAEKGLFPRMARTLSSRKTYPADRGSRDVRRRKDAETSDVILSNRASPEKRKEKGQMKQRNRLLSLLLVMALTAAAVLTIGSCGNKNQTPVESGTAAVTEAVTEAATEAATEAQAETVTVTLIVVGKDEAKTTYTIVTEAKTLRAAFADAEGLTVEGDETEYGLYIKTVNGLRGDYNEDGYFWSLCDKDGNMTPNGADTTEIADGDVYQLIYTKA